MGIFADLRDLAAVEHLLADLPADVFGQLYLRCDGEIPAFRSPARVQTLRLSGEVSLPSAFSAWTAEWITDEAVAGGELPLVWIFPWAAASLSGTCGECVIRIVTSLPSTHLIQGYDGTLPALLGAASGRPVA